MDDAKLAALKEGIKIPFPQQVNTIRALPPLRTEQGAAGNPGVNQH